MSTPAPIDVELAVAETAAIERARASLRERPPAACHRCGRTADDAHFREERDVWRCTPCGAGTVAAPPTAAEEREVITRARTEARAKVLAPGDAWLRRR